MPLAEKLAVVASAVGALNVTVPGPLTLLQLRVSALGGFGSPSSEALPVSCTLFGSVIVRSAPALTVGGRLPGSMRTMRPSVGTPSVSITKRRYVPGGASVERAGACTDRLPPFAL